MIAAEARAKEQEMRIITFVCVYVHCFEKAIVRSETSVLSLFSYTARLENLHTQHDTITNSFPLKFKAITWLRWNGSLPYLYWYFSINLRLYLYTMAAFFLLSTNPHGLDTRKCQSANEYNDENMTETKIWRIRKWNRKKIEIMNRTRHKNCSLFNSMGSNEENKNCMRLWILLLSNWVTIVLMQTKNVVLESAIIRNNEFRQCFFFVLKKEG